MLGEVMAVACFISPNPSPMEWMASGPPAKLADLEAAASDVPAIRRVARAMDGDIAFVRYELGPSLTYGDWMAFLHKAEGLDVLRSTPSHIVPSCPDGRAGDLDDSHAAPLIVGVVGAPAKTSAVIRELGWPGTAVRLADGQSAVRFEPPVDQDDRYAQFVARAAKDAWPEVKVVLLRAD
ncbi:hypothetical protein GGQ61_000218 [Phenylobacterium haematophilum]|jgi:hypothetical protein|uniref:Uncharacterized protein n=1 Tax=Phenylobacterium haematophilum TaxID=98513 RepID=A0A839ZVW8_9CAUL|nr:hypothetical protein [Phenylobacterium haematophilum]MBB3889521.1 hypothetical protein [Phenylobacterium haematophilum]